MHMHPGFTKLYNFYPTTSTYQKCILLLTILSSQSYQDNVQYSLLAS